MHDILWRGKSWIPVFPVRVVTRNPVYCRSSSSSTGYSAFYMYDSSMVPGRPEFFMIHKNGTRRSQVHQIVGAHNAQFNASFTRDSPHTLIPHTSYLIPHLLSPSLSCVMRYPEGDGTLIQSVLWWKVIYRCYYAGQRSLSHMVLCTVSSVHACVCITTIFLQWSPFKFAVSSRSSHNQQNNNQCYAEDHCLRSEFAFRSEINWDPARSPPLSCRRPTTSILGSMPWPQSRTLIASWLDCQNWSTHSYWQQAPCFQCRH